MAHRAAFNVPFQFGPFEEFWRFGEPIGRTSFALCGIVSDWKQSPSIPRVCPRTAPKWIWTEGFVLVFAWRRRDGVSDHSAPPPSGGLDSSEAVFLVDPDPPPVRSIFPSKSILASLISGEGPIGFSQCGQVLSPSSRSGS